MKEFTLLEQFFRWREQTQSQLVTMELLICFGPALVLIHYFKRIQLPVYAKVVILCNINILSFN